tara:strand:- start:857 stop:1060 length:204 start_codon:yes stop_codon:yes gene_type:complete
MKWNKDQILKLRRDMEVSQKDFATMAGVTITAVSRWENGHAKPSYFACERLNLLHAEYGELMEATRL